MLAARNFNALQALEREIKHLYCRISAGTRGVATLDLTTDVVLTSVAPGLRTSFQLVVNAAAANPTDTVLVAFTGSAAAVVCTVTPNDGTNNAATPVSLDEDELAELINSGLVAGKTITLTDASSLRALQTATGGAAADALVAGNSQTVSFVGDAEPALVSGEGVASVSRTAAGEIEITLDDKYASVKSIDAVLLQSTAADIQFQLASESIATDKKCKIWSLAGATKTDPADSASILVKFELKNTGV